MWVISSTVADPSREMGGYWGRPELRAGCAASSRFSLRPYRLAVGGSGVGWAVITSAAFPLAVMLFSDTSHGSRSRTPKWAFSAVAFCFGGTFAKAGARGTRGCLCVCWSWLR